MVVKKQNRYIYSQSKEQNVETRARAVTEKSCIAPFALKVTDKNILWIVVFLVYLHDSSSTSLSEQTKGIRRDRNTITAKRRMLY